MHPIDVMEDEKQSRTRSTTKSFVRVPRWRCRRPILTLQPRNPQVASRALPRQSWRCLGCCLDKAAPLALSPAPNRRCLGSETNLLAQVSLGRAQVPWPATLESSSWKRVVTRPDGVSRALSGPWVVAALLAVPSELRAPRSRRQGGRRVQNNRNLQ